MGGGKGAAGGVNAVEVLEAAMCVAGCMPAAPGKRRVREGRATGGRVERAREGEGVGVGSEVFGFQSDVEAAAVELGEGVKALGPEHFEVVGGREPGGVGGGECDAL